MNKVNKVKKLLATVILASLCVASVSSVWYCVKAGVADASTLGLRATLAQYQSNGTLPNPVAWQELQQGLQEASQLAPDAPQYHEDLAYLYAVRGVAAMRFDAVARPNLELAKTNYQQALTTRPMTPATWANLALLTNYLDAKNTTEIDHLVNTATQLGPNDPKTQMTLFYVGMQRWNTLDKQQKQHLKEILMHTRPPFKANMLAAAAQFNIVELMPHAL